MVKEKKYNQCKIIHYLFCELASSSVVISILIRLFFFFRTSAAMSGKMSFRESLSTRLNLIQPSMQQVQEFIRSKPPTLSVNIK